MNYNWTDDDDVADAAAAAVAAAATADVNAPNDVAFATAAMADNNNPAPKTPPQTRVQTENFVWGGMGSRGGKSGGRGGRGASRVQGNPKKINVVDWGRAEWGKELGPENDVQGASARGGGERTRGEGS
jgi:hypothetical protein